MTYAAPWRAMHDQRMGVALMPARIAAARIGNAVDRTHNITLICRVCVSTQMSLWPEDVHIFLGVAIEPHATQAQGSDTAGISRLRVDDIAGGRQIPTAPQTRLHGKNMNRDVALGEALRDRKTGIAAAAIANQNLFIGRQAGTDRIVDTLRFVVAVRPMDMADPTDQPRFACDLVHAT